jgi:hypothetical protein
MTDELACEPLPAFDATELATVQRAFRAAAPCALQQAWLDRPEAGFAPAVVRTGWRDRTLLVLAELTDADIFNGARELNDRAWELGDVLEIFLRPADQERYVELQVTPENQRLQLRFGSRAELEASRTTGQLDAHFVWGEAFRSTTWIEAGVWHVYAEIPAETVCGANVPLDHARWRFSFSRQDYTRGVAEPVLSSTSPHPEADFHRQEDWRVMIFRGTRTP